MEIAERIRVVSRFKPVHKNDTLEKSDKLCIEYTGDPSTCQVCDEHGHLHRFSLQKVYSEDTQQEDLFAGVGVPAVKEVLEGYNGTIFAYGQTGSGKTHTILGPPTVDGACDLTGVDRGIVPRVAEKLFAEIEAAPVTQKFSVSLSFIEVYMERLRDLLQSGEPLILREDTAAKAFYAEGARWQKVSTLGEVCELIRRGVRKRQTAQNNINVYSSRSHSIVCLEVMRHDLASGMQQTARLHLVDLAGSEKVRKTLASGERLEEAKMINKSLTSLSLVISKLSEACHGAHVPYRNSVLTRLLQDSLGGNSRTTLVVCTSPLMYNVQETLSTLRFAVSASRVTNHAVVNRKKTNEELRDMLSRAYAEIRSLRGRLEESERNASVPVSNISTPPPSHFSRQGQSQVPTVAAIKVRTADIQEPHVQKQDSDLPENKRGVKPVLKAASKERIFCSFFSR